MPLTFLKTRKHCTKCSKQLPTKVYTHEIKYNRASALNQEPTVVQLLLCAECHAALTDRMFSSMMLMDNVDIGAHYGRQD